MKYRDERLLVIIGSLILIPFSLFVILNNNKGTEITINTTEQNESLPIKPNPYDAFTFEELHLLIEIKIRYEGYERLSDERLMELLKVAKETNYVWVSPMTIDGKKYLNNPHIHTSPNYGMPFFRSESEKEKKKRLLDEERDPLRRIPTYNWGELNELERMDRIRKEVSEYNKNKSLMLSKNIELWSAYERKREEFIKQWQEEMRSKGGYLYE